MTHMGARIIAYDFASYHRCNESLPQQCCARTSMPIFVVESEVYRGFARHLKPCQVKDWVRRLWSSLRESGLQVLLHAFLHADSWGRMCLWSSHCRAARTHRGVWGCCSHVLHWMAALRG